jgi:hypothetical protein
MKIKLLLFVVALFAFSCSKDEDPAPTLETVTLSLAQDQGITAPPAMATSSNQYAQEAYGYIEMANLFENYSDLFKIPDGATKLTTKITATNGRINNTGDYVTYEWTDTGSGYKFALQISEQSDQYTWEIFVKTGDQTNYLKFIEATEKKDKSSGSFKVYDYTDPAPATELWLDYVWTRNGDTLHIVLIEFAVIKVDMTINTKTKAGNFIVYMDNEKLYEMAWDAQGNGTWKYFENGVLTDQGSWTV